MKEAAARKSLLCPSQRVSSLSHCTFLADGGSRTNQFPPFNELYETYEMCLKCGAQSLIVPGLAAQSLSHFHALT